MKRHINKRTLFLLFFLLAVLPLTVILVQKTQQYLGKAAGQEANIVVDAAIIQGPITPYWQMLAQGGEEKDAFSGIIPQIMALNPRYIRIDHIYDFYDVVIKQNNELIFDFTQLDIIVDKIRSTGAIPFFSLSYMPLSIAKDSVLTNPPQDWNDWSLLVQKTIQHYSGKNEKNLNNVMYEVWNEPDLFGGWKIGGKNDYRLLYHYAINGANKTVNINPFKIGGPATTAPYQTWVDNFLDYIVKNNLRLDFYSWHRYSKNPEDYLNDINRVDTWLFKNAGHSVSKFITEFGSDSENSSLHDKNFDAAHLISISAVLLQRIDGLFTFEIKDGPSPEGKKYWGRWGLLTHESAGPIEKKPKYKAFQLLNEMKGTRLSFSGAGTWVTGFTTKEGPTIRIILSNLDVNEKHYETVPISINNLSNDNYSYKETFLEGFGRTITKVVDTGVFQEQVILSPNNIVLIEISPS